MEVQKLFGLILVLALLATSSGVSDAATSFSPSAQDHIYVCEKSTVLDTPYHVSSGCEYCSEPNCESYLICEDWESGDAGDFPFTKNSVYHDARAGNYGSPENNRITNEFAHSGSRSLKLEKPTPSKGGGDVEFSFPNQDEIYVRWYYYFPTGWAEGLDDCRSGHLLAINTIYHGWLILDNANSYATSMDLPNVEIGDWSDEGGNVWSAHCDPPSDVWDRVRSVRFDEVWGTERGSAEEITGPNEWHHDYPNDRLYVYSTSAPDTAFTNPGIWVADNARRWFNLGETLGCPGRSTITLGGCAAENESYCWNCDNKWGTGKHSSGDSTKPLYHRDEDTDNTYWSIYDHEDEWVCFEWYINNNDHATKLWIDGDLWLESTPAMFTWGEDGHFDDGFNKIIFSNYRHDETFHNTLYIDDVVVSTSYIGPRTESPELALTGAPADQAIHLSWTVNTTLPVTSTWQIDCQSETGTLYTPITGIISPTRAYTLTGLTNHSWYTVTLSAMRGSVSFLADTVRVMPTDIFVYLPLVLKGDTR